MLPVNFGVEGKSFPTEAAHVSSDAPGQAVMYSNDPSGYQ
jgi:hypothetical protein